MPASFTGGDRSADTRAVSSWPPHASSVGQVRRWIRSLCRDARPAEVCDDAELLLTELVSNAIRHAGTAVEVEIVITASGRLQLKVRDGSTRPLRVQPMDPLAEGGRGLHLVDLLASRWGVEADQRGKLVWAELN